jgi:pimeloyl-ACP methyl ester carboxylesterase
MTEAKVNGHRLFFELSGRGVPVVLVHGSWASHAIWEPVVPALAARFRVLAYDRRGHSRSERPAGQDSVHDDVDDLAALIEHLGMAPAWVVGNSYGAAITLRLAADRPELLRGVIAHEPPLFDVLKDDPAIAPMLGELNQGIERVASTISAGDHAKAAKDFVEEVALGPGSWQQFPPEVREQIIFNAPTFLDETRDPDGLSIDLDRLRAFDKPMLLTTGDQSPPYFGPVVTKLQAACPGANVQNFRGAGHLPHMTHPDAFVEKVAAFIESGGG